MKNKSYFVVMLLVIISLIIAGCAAPANQATTAAPTSAPSSGATSSSSQPNQLVMGVNKEPETYLPGFESSALASFGFELVFNKLTTYDLKGTMVGDLASTWDLSSDELTWTFHLVPGVNWQDGQPFSAKDVLFTLEILADPNYTGTYYSMIATVVGAVDKHDGKATSISGVKLIDDNTISITTETPDALFLETMVSVMPILPEHILKDIAVPDLATSSFARNPIGTGPYMLKDWKSNTSLSFEANSNYFKGAPKIQTFIWQVIPETSALTTALLNGEINFLYEIAADDFSLLQANTKIQTLQVPGTRFYSLNMHVTNPLLADVRVRQAIAHAVNRQALLDGISGGLGKVENSIFHPSLPEYDPNLTGFAYDIDQAKSILQEVGWTDQNNDGFLEAKGVQGVADGTKFTVELGTQTTDPFPKINEVLQQDLKAIGIDAQIKTMDSNNFYSNYFVAGGPWQLGAGGWSNLIGSPQQELLWNVTCDSQSYYDYCNKDLDVMIAKNTNLFNADERTKNFFAIQETLEQQAIELPLTRPDNLIAFTKGLVTPDFQSTVDIYRSLPNFTWNK
jgi:peptide/nickel transport system substrate-binding protein